MAALVKTFGPLTDVRLVETLSHCFVIVHTPLLRDARCPMIDGPSYSLRAWGRQVADPSRTAYCSVAKAICLRTKPRHSVGGY